jgi:exonuclease SbcD
MKILHTADWHLGRKLEGRSRHLEQAAVLDEICGIADEEAVDAVLIAGDVFDTYNPPAESEALFYETMTRLADGGRRAVVVLAGNHDSPDRLIASSPYARALGISTLGYPKDVPHLYDGGTGRSACVESAPSFVRLRVGSGEILSVLALPYPSETRLREVLTADIADEEGAARDYNNRIRGFMSEAARAFLPGEANIIASHLFIAKGSESDSERQIQVGGAYTVDPMSFPAEAGYVALGHLHRPQETPGEKDIAIRYSGSILQYSFSEEEQQKSVTIAEFDGGRATHRTVPLGAGRTLECWNVTGGVEELEQRLAEASPELWLSIRITLDNPLTLETMARIRSQHPGIASWMTEIRRIDGERDDYRPIASLPLEEQFRRFVQDRFKEECSDDVVKLLLSLAGERGEGESG